MPFHITNTHPVRLLKPGESCVWFSANKYHASASVYKDHGKNEHGTHRTSCANIGRHKGGFKSSEENYRKLGERAEKIARDGDMPFCVEGPIAEAQFPLAVSAE